MLRENSETGIPGRSIMQTKDMTIEKLYDIRRSRLKEETIKFGKLVDFCDQFNLDASYINQLLNSHRSIGEKTARNIERKIGKPWGFLDIPPESEAFNEIVCLLHTLDDEGLWEIYRHCQILAEKGALRR